MSKRESVLNRGEDDDDYWSSSNLMLKLKSDNLFEVDHPDDSDRIEDDQWSAVDGWERLPRVTSDTQSFSAGSVADRLDGSARYRADSASGGAPDLGAGVQLLGLGEPSYRDLTDDIEPVTLRKNVSRKKPTSTSYSPEQVVKDMILGQPYNLEQFKSKEDKLTLLDTAIEARDGNAIMAVLLFLKSTLKKSVFTKIMYTRPQAVNHFTYFLKAHYDFTELEDTLCMFQRTEDAAILKYYLAASKTKAGDRVRALQTCYRTHFEYEPSLVNEGQLLKQHIALLERQQPIEDSDRKAIADGTSSSLLERPRQVNSIVDLPLVSTLHYCCLYHYSDPPNFLTSPHGIKAEYKLDERQFLYWALRARAVFHDYAAIQTLLTAKNWFGGKKLKSVIPWEKVVEMLEASSAPSEVLIKYLKLIDDDDSRIQLAKKYKCHEVAIETFKAMKDRRRLETYVAKVLEPGSEDYRSAQGALNGTSVKWKN